MSRTQQHTVDVIEQIVDSRELSFFGRLKKRIVARLNRIPIVRALEVAKVHSALTAGQVKVHAIRPIGACTYVVHIDGEPELEAIRAAWQPSLSKRMFNGVTGHSTFIPAHKIGDFERALLEANSFDSTRLIAASSVTTNVMDSVPVERYIIGQQQNALATIPQFTDDMANVQEETSAAPMVYTINDAISSLLKASGFNVAGCNELGDGGYGTRYLQLVVA